MTSDFFVHATAIVEPGASIGSATRVWHHAHVRTDATVGSDCVLGKNVFVDRGVTVGNRVKIQNNVSVYEGVTIADEVFVGPSATFTNDRLPRATSTNWKIVPTDVQRGASIGANATIVCGVTLGEYSMVGAGAIVTHDVENHELVIGAPARHAGWVCACGELLTRDHDRPDDLRCEHCRAREEHA